MADLGRGPSGKPRSAGAMLVELLIVVVIIGILAVVYLGLSKRSGMGTSAETTPGAALEKAHGVECASNLNQLRALLQIEMSDNERWPAALDPNNTMNRCPVSGKPYVYDPQTGRVQCTTPGHERF